MVTVGKRSRDPPSSSYQEILMAQRRQLVFLCLVVVGFVVWCWGANVVGRVEERNINGDASTDTTSTSAPIKTTKKLVNLCEDADADASDPIEIENIKQCKCGDPAIGTPNPKRKGWMEFHERWVESARYAVSASTTQQQLDVCMVGDSLIEHWNGTVGLGKQKQPKLRAVFDKYFGDSGGGLHRSLRGMAFGASADTSRMLLWHLQNGILNNSKVQPRVWLLLVGTNDLGHALCAKQSALDGILYVADAIKRERPDASILIHGLLPRGGSTGNGNDMVLGRYWKLIQWVNSQLQQAVKQRPDFYYMDSGNLFIGDDGKKMNSTFVEDGIHPEAPGLQVWGPKIVRAVQAILEDGP